MQLIKAYGMSITYRCSLVELDSESVREQEVNISCKYCGYMKDRVAYIISELSSI